MSPLRHPSTAHRNSYYAVEGSAFLDDYGPEIVRANTLGHKIDGLFVRRKTNWGDKRRKSSRKIRSWTPLLEHLRGRSYTFRALLPILGALLQTFLLLFLFFAYYTLPADPVTGAKPPRVGGRYANFQFISCIGSHQLALYRGITFAIVILGIISTSITFYFCRDDLLRRQTRRAGLIASSSGAGLSIWVVFAAATPNMHLHLTVVAVEAIIVFCIKTTGMLIDHYDRSRYPALR